MQSVAAHVAMFHTVRSAHARDYLAHAAPLDTVRGHVNDSVIDKSFVHVYTSKMETRLLARMVPGAHTKALHVCKWTALATCLDRPVPHRVRAERTGSPTLLAPLHRVNPVAFQPAFDALHGYCALVLAAFHSLPVLE